MNSSTKGEKVKHKPQAIAVLNSRIIHRILRFGATPRTEHEDHREPGSQRGKPGDQEKQGHQGGGWQGARRTGGILPLPDLSEQNTLITFVYPSLSENLRHFGKPQLSRISLHRPRAATRKLFAVWMLLSDFATNEIVNFFRAKVCFDWWCARQGTCNSDKHALQQLFRQEKQVH